MPDPIDPTALFHQMLGQWEQMANTLGGGVLRNEGFAQAMHGAGAAAMQAQQAAEAAGARALAAANLPSRAEVIDLADRLTRVEASLVRIEASLAALAGTPPTRDDRSRPKRTRTPPPSGG